MRILPYLHKTVKRYDILKIIKKYKEKQNHSPLHKSLKNAINKTRKPRKER